MAIQKEIPQDPRDAGKNNLAPVIDIATQTKVSPQEKVRQDEEGLSILDRRTAIRSEKRRKRKSRLLKWGLSTASAAIIGTAIGVAAYETIPAVEQAVNRFVTGSNPPSEIPDQPPPVPPVEIPKVEVPESFVAKEEPFTAIGTDRTVTGIHTKGTVKEGVNTMFLTEKKLSTVVEKNPDVSAINYEGLSTKHVVFPIKSGKSVDFKTSVTDMETYGEDGKLKSYRRSGGTVFYLHEGDTVQLFVPKAEVFRLPPWVVGKEEYYTKLLIKETLSSGEIQFYEVETYNGGRVFDIEIADEFKNAPVIKGSLPHLWLNQTGQFASMTADENGILTAPDLLTVKKEGLNLLMSAFGKKLVFYTDADENGDTKVVKPS